MTKRGILTLEDGSKFAGKVFGSEKSIAGEVVFTTGMVGYEQSLTDPSYSGQILTFTYPLIGNWGVPDKKFWESEKIQVSGLVISDLSTRPSHHLSKQTLDSWLKDEGIIGLYEVDTRKLTQKIRDKGVMLGKIVVGNQDIKFDDPNSRNLVSEVSIDKVKVWKPEINNKRSTINPKIGFLNCGAKRHVLKNLIKRNFTVYELPWDWDPFENNLKIEGLVISNGPGDPKMPKKTIDTIKKALLKKMPTFGVCLGNQLLALAAGGDTYKLKFGHRAQNQPTMQVGTKRCYITTQNHGFAVSEKKLPSGFKRWFYNANDNTNEGIIHEKLPFFSVQFHPEATPGPYDTEWLFDFFAEKFK